MKKIITAVAAVAMATTMFAADVAATVKMAGSLFNLDGSKNVSLLKVADDATESYKAAVTLSVSGDKAGASINYGNKPALTRVAHNIWFAPVDALKITLGNSDKAINQEKIDWSNTETNVGGYGFKADVNVDAFSASVMLYGGEGNYWFANKAASITAVNMGFSGDWGNAGVLAYFDANFKKMAFAAGYSGAIDATGYFVNAIAYLNEGFAAVRGELYVSTAIESVGISAFVPVVYYASGAKAFNLCGNNWHLTGIGYGAAPADNSVAVGTTLKVTVPVAEMTGSLYVKCNDWLNLGTVEVKPGLSGSCGIMGWEAYLDMNVGKGTFTLDVPFVTTINF